MFVSAVFATMLAVLSMVSGGVVPSSVVGGSPDITHPHSVVGGMPEVQGTGVIPS